MNERENANVDRTVDGTAEQADRAHQELLKDREGGSPSTYGLRTDPAPRRPVQPDDQRGHDGRNGGDGSSGRR